MNHKALKFFFLIHNAIEILEYLINRTQNIYNDKEKKERNLCHTNPSPYWQL